MTRIEAIATYRQARRAYRAAHPVTDAVFAEKAAVHLPTGYPKAWASAAEWASAACVVADTCRIHVAVDRATDGADYWPERGAGAFPELAGEDANTYEGP